MAGHNNNALANDPAYVQYNHMWKNRHKYFRWNARSGWITFAYVVVVPTIVGIMAYRTDGKYEMRGKRRGDIISEW